MHVHVHDQIRTFPCLCFWLSISMFTFMTMSLSIFMTISTTIFMSLGHVRDNDFQVSVRIYSTIKFMPTCCLLFHVMIWASSVQRQHSAALLSAKILARGCSSCNPTTWLQKILFSRHFYIFKLNSSKEMDTHGTAQMWTLLKSIPSKNIEKILEKKRHQNVVITVLWSMRSICNHSCSTASPMVSGRLSDATPKCC
jgi:hypothetical protein